MSLTFVLDIGEEIPNLIPLDYVPKEELDNTPEYASSIPIIPEKIYQEAINLFGI